MGWPFCPPCHPFALPRASPCSTQAVFRGVTAGNGGQSLLEEGWWVRGGDAAAPGGIPTEAGESWGCPGLSHCAVTQIHVPKWVSSHGMVALACAGNVGGSRTFPWGTGQCPLLETGCNPSSPTCSAIMQIFSHSHPIKSLSAVPRWEQNSLVSVSQGDVCWPGKRRELGLKEE